MEPLIRHGSGLTPTLACYLSLCLLVSFSWFTHHLWSCPRRGEWPGGGSSICGGGRGRLAGFRRAGQIWECLADAAEPAGAPGGGKPAWPGRAGPLPGQPGQDGSGRRPGATTTVNARLRPRGRGARTCHGRPYRAPVMACRCRAPRPAGRGFPRCAAPWPAVRGWRRAPSAWCHSAVQINRVRRSGPPSISANGARFSSSPTRCRTVPPSATRATENPAVATHTAPSASMQMPSGPRPSANTRRPDSPPSASMSNAVSRPANDSEMISVRPSGVMSHAVGELDVVGDLAQLPVRRDELDVARLGRRTGGDEVVEVRAVDVGVAARVHDDLVRPLPGVDGHRPVRAPGAGPCRRSSAACRRAASRWSTPSGGWPGRG